MSEDYLLKTKTVWENCQKHLEVFQKSSSEIQKESPIESVQNYLTQHLLIVLCAEVEEQICGFLSERAKKAKDPAIKALVDSWAKRVIRSVGYEELIGIIKIFGKGYKEKFESLIDEGSKAYYSIVVKGRHNVAHYSESQSQVTMKEFEKGLKSAEEILIAFRKTLNPSISSSPPNLPPSNAYSA